ncbi:outer membrane beta-barrel protein [Haliscomenobacter hydrossis]|uniref:Outer membrane protein beta-barrel domain-containing protein n=1 Tax=Haliscomenobacter hydrossis (strain ATCC 27775 / DSM 1100 / LMG 10767 / O) TaxID=760192 RepID=F4L536_HALH1|nr:outer membrane beta-barrel protein [Haliscomenobacter hydrossis]AEE48757.1 hypothetical protein Halhy_0852 [Haliscomenobacter hydrossis DSM 1100]
MNHLYAALTTLFLFFQMAILSSQTLTFIGLNGSGWPRNLQVRGVLQGSIEKKNIAQQVELGYVRRENFSIRNPISGAAYYYQPLIGAFELSAFWKMSVNFDEFRFFGLIGPAISHGIEAEAFIVEESGRSYQAIIPWEKLGINRWELGAYAGMGIESITTKGVKIQIDFRYYFGLSDLLPGEASAYNEGALLGMGIGLPLGRRIAH